MTDIYDLKSYDYMLPPEQIATHPVHPRDAAKLLVWKDGCIEHKIFSDLVDLLSSGDLIVANASKVIPARLFGTRPPRDATAPAITVEILLHRPRGNFSEWSAFAKPAKRLKQGDVIQIADGFSAEVMGRDDDQVILHFPYPPEQVEALLEQHGHIPLPPYIERADDETDRTEYQTVYADQAGSIAAPTAGLHFTDELLEKLQAKEIGLATVTLHVGAGTFLPVTVDDIRKHKMHSEWGQVDDATAARIREVQEKGGKIIAVGTTATRLLETAARDTGQIQAWQGDTDIFITPGFQFNVVDRLITNFHLPKSTLLMLVSAFMGDKDTGIDRMQDLYAQAIKENYRFYSYGDACLLTRS
jgi:S-adenosylmethionine:tRNA ribosyltransferase-isomerase